MLNLRSICFFNGSPQEHVDFQSLPPLPDTPKSPQVEPCNVLDDAKPSGESKGNRFMALAIGNLGSCLESPRRMDAWNETEELRCRPEGSNHSVKADWTMDGDTLMADDPFEVGMMLESLRMAIEAEVRGISGGELEGANNMEETQV